MNGQLLFVANVGEIVDHGKPGELVGAYLLADGPSACDDDLGKMIVEGDACAAHGERGVGVEDEGGQR